MDVTEAHLAQEEARNAQLWLESILDSLAEAVIVTDALGFIRNVNPAARGVLRLAGQRVIRPADREAHSDARLPHEKRQDAEFSYGAGRALPGRRHDTGPCAGHYSG